MRRPDVTRFWAHAAAIMAASALLLPLFWLITGSLRSQASLFHFPPEWLPIPPHWDNYLQATRYVPYFTYFRNSVVVASLNVIGTMVSAPLVAYGFSRIRWGLRNVLFFVMLSTVFLPFQATMIPLYVLYRQVGWINTFYPLTVPAFLGGNVFLIFLLRQFFLNIPRELSEAAQVEGASHFQILWHIMLPLSKPALAAVGIFSFVWAWTDFQTPLIFLNSSSLYTLSVGLVQYESLHYTAWTYMLAGSVIYLMPMVVIFLLAQRHFIRGIALSGTQG
jgi:multiple sugar transport system permease protein